MIHFRFPGGFCSDNLRACTPGGAARMARRAGGLSGEDRTLANRQGQPEQHRPETSSGFRGLHFQRPPRGISGPGGSSPKPRPQGLPPPGRGGPYSAWFRRCFCTFVRRTFGIFFSLVGKGIFTRAGEEQRHAPCIPPGPPWGAARPGHSAPTAGTRSPLPSSAS